MKEEERRGTTQKQKDFTCLRFGMPVRPDIGSWFYCHTQSLDRVLKSQMKIMMRPFPGRLLCLVDKRVQQCIVDLFHMASLFISGESPEPKISNNLPEMYQYCLQVFLIRNYSV